MMCPIPPIAMRVACLWIVGLLRGSEARVRDHLSMDLGGRCENPTYFLKTSQTAATKRTAAKAWFQRNTWSLKATVLKRTKTSKVTTS